MNPHLTIDKQVSVDGGAHWLEQGSGGLTNPTLLLLDEPLASLDLKSQHEIVHLVEAIRTERQMAVILVAHDLNPLLEICNLLPLGIRELPVLQNIPVQGALAHNASGDPYHR